MIKKILLPLLAVCALELPPFSLILIGQSSDQKPDYPDEIIPLRGKPFKGKILKFEGNNLYIEITRHKITQVIVLSADSLQEVNKDFGPTKISIWKKEPPSPSKVRQASQPRLRIPPHQAYDVKRDTVAALAIERDSIFVGEIDKTDTSQAQRTLIDQMPVPLRKPATEYPRGAASRGLEGHVKLRLWIDKEGTPKKWAIVECTDSIFVENSIRSAMKWEFSPAVVKGTPVGVWAAVSFEFMIQR